MSATPSCIASARPGLPSDATPRYAQVLVVVGMRDTSRAVGVGVDLATRDGAEIGLVAVVEHGMDSDGLAARRRRARAAVLAASLELPEDLHPSEFVCDGEAIDAVAGAARAWGADLIVVSDAITHAAPVLARLAGCPVLCIEPSERRPADRAERLVYPRPEHAVAPNIGASARA